jgi:hypothetical protein
MSGLQRTLLEVRTRVEQRNRLLRRALAAVSTDEATEEATPAEARPFRRAGRA